MTQMRIDGPASLTSCTVVVPTYNRPAQLERCLAALATQTYPRESWEVIVVDDGGRTPLDGIVAAARERMRVRLLRQENAGPARARNHGVRHAEGALIAFTDDDCAPEPGWLASFATAHRQAPDALLGGHTWNALHDHPCATASQMLLDYLHEYYNVADGTRREFFASNNIAVSREGFLGVGGFDSVFPRAAGEDRELCATWRHQGRPFLYVPDARVAHAHAMSLRGFVRQHLNYGRAANYFRIREAARTGRGVRVEPLAFYTGMFTFPFRRLGVGQAVRMAALLFVSQAANATGFFAERVKARHGRRP